MVAREAHRRVVRRARARVRPVAGVVAVLVLVACGGGRVRPGAEAHRDPRDHRDRTVEVLGAQESRGAPSSTPTLAAPSSTTTTTTTTTSIAAPAPPSPPARAVVAATSAPAVATSCADALAYLAAHQAPGFTDRCADGSAFGHLGVTCVNQPGMCAGARIVHIACPAPFVYMNEAHNSWVLTGARRGIDPYGQGTDAERAACASHR